MTVEQKLDLGITLVGALKANAYNCSLDEGILMALEGTELDRLPQEELDLLAKNGKGAEMIRAVVGRERKILHKQALALANAALDKIEQLKAVLA